LVSNHSDSSNLLRTREEVLEFFAPKASPFDFSLFGGRKDGAYLLPLQLIREVTFLFSAGCENRQEFEHDLLVSFGIRSSLLDRSSVATEFSPPLDPSMQEFRQLWLGSEDTDESISLESWVQQSSPRGEGGYVLKMDIEGAEYASIIAAPRPVLEKFSILVIEVHGVASSLNREREAERLRTFCEKLNDTFIAVHARVNNSRRGTPVGTHGEVPEIMEIVLINKNLFSQYEHLGIKKLQIPHPKDLRLNDPRNPPRYLKGSLRQHASASSIPKVMSDWCFFVLSNPKWVLKMLVNRLYLVAPGFFSALRKGSRFS